MLGLMDISVKRNAFGRQAESFETDLEVPEIVTPENSQKVHAVFIRAPLIESVGADVLCLPGFRMVVSLPSASEICWRRPFIPN